MLKFISHWYTLCPANSHSPSLSLFRKHHCTYYWIIIQGKTGILEEPASTDTRQTDFSSLQVPHSLFEKCPGSTSKPQPLPFPLFAVRSSLIIPFFDVTLWLELVTSLNNALVNRKTQLLSSVPLDSMYTTDPHQHRTATRLSPLHDFTVYKVWFTKVRLPLFIWRYIYDIKHKPFNL